jgi:spore coat polysaccharide biosynthesis protein SpsF (cytidylyltransferase family)
MTAALNNILIGIQARSTSARLPNKHVEMIGGRRIIDHVIDSCLKSSSYLNKYASKNGYVTEVALLTPYGDPLVEAFTGKIKVVEGPEDEVLSRYKMAHEAFDCDYIVRVTGDCPFIPPHVISKHIVIAFKNHYDYVSNVDERFRTTLDGVDCEVMSRKMLEWLYESATEPADREHVTTLARRQKPSWARAGFITSYFDLSGIKLSIDTQDDLARARKEFDRLSRKYHEAERVFGKNYIHRF